MKLLMLLVFAILGCSVVTPLQGKQAQRFLEVKDKNFVGRGVWKSSVFPIAEELTSKKEYVFLTDESGLVIIMDAHSYDVIYSYILPDIAHSSVAITDDTLYSIDTMHGTIMSTSIESIVTGENVNWALVGSFPTEDDYVKNGAVVHGSYIYFTTNIGKLYRYDTISKTVTKVGDSVGSRGAYASLVVVNDVVYVFKNTKFYSFDNGILKEIPTPSEGRDYAGLIQLGNDVCIVGGISPKNLDPVNCYDSVKDTWFVSSYLNDGRRFAAFARTEKGPIVFGGWSDGSTYFSSSEILNYETRNWTYIPHPLNAELRSPQAATFYY